MPRRPHRNEPGSDLDHRVPMDIEVYRRSARAKARAILRWVKLGGLMLASAIVIPVVMITGGWLLGPKGYEGVFLAPLSVITSWALILFFGLRRRSTPKRIVRADVRELPSRVAEWLDDQRPKLPDGAQRASARIVGSLAELEQQVQDVSADSATSRALRKLLVEELTPLVEGYRKLPRRIQRAPLHGGPSPAERLVEGLNTVDSELTRMRENIAQDDLQSLATHQRYLEMKYGDDD